MTVEEIKKILSKTATVFSTGGIEPTNNLLESWIGKVGWQSNNESQPIDEQGNKMVPLATIFLDSNKYVPEQLSKIKLITIYMSTSVWDNLEDYELTKYFKINTYENLEKLVQCNYTSEKIKAFPLVSNVVNNEFPMWDNGGIPRELRRTIIEVEKSENINYFDDIYENNNGMHKLGGYPTFCQSGYWFGDGYDYVLQISSDSKAEFNIVDDGNFYFYYNPELNDWKVYCDFY